MLIVMYTGVSANIYLVATLYIYLQIILYT
jgi:hypothetical protein